MKCGFCPFESKAGPYEQRALNNHLRKHQPKEEKVEVHEISKAPAVEGEVSFYSPRLPFIQIVVVPSEWRLVEGPAGAKQYPVEGITVEFDNGRYVTSNPKIIAYLEGNKEEAKKLGLVDKKGDPRVYNDPKFPILSDRKMREMATKGA